MIIIINIFKVAVLVAETPVRLTRPARPSQKKGKKPVIVRPQGQLINRVKVPVGVSHNVVAESNCVIVKWGGEQLEAKGQSAE